MVAVVAKAVFSDAPNCAEIAQAFDGAVIHYGDIGAR